MDIEEFNLELYVRNKSGQFFRAKGYGGYGASWVDGINKARIYNKISPAKGVVTWFATHQGRFGVPDILKLNVTSFDILDQAARVQLVKEDKQKKLAIKKAKEAIEDLENAQRKFEQAKERLEKLKSING